MLRGYYEVRKGMQALARYDGSRGHSDDTPRPEATSRPGLRRSILLNIIGLGGLWVLYSLVRTVTADSWGVASDNAQWLIRFQDRVGLPSEALFQSVFLDHEWFLRSANIFYVGAHFPSIFLFLGWAMVRWREHMPQIRWALIGSTAAGLVIHLAFPLAPPRLLGFSEFVDTATTFGPDPYAFGVSDAANKLAAMPSMHVGWALLIALFVIQIANSRFRWLVLLHPITTTVVVVVTANHYWTDVLAGAALAVLGWWLASRVARRPHAQADSQPTELDVSDADHKEIALS